MKGNRDPRRTSYCEKDFTVNKVFAELKVSKSVYSVSYIQGKGILAFLNQRESEHLSSNKGKLEMRKGR